MNRFEVKGRYFDDLRSGVKTAEGRNPESRMVKETRIGEIVTIYRGDESFMAEILQKRYYPLVEEMLFEVGLKKMLPDKETLEEGIEVYRKFGTTGEAVAVFIRPLA